MNDESTKVGFLGDVNIYMDGVCITRKMSKALHIFNIENSTDFCFIANFTDSYGVRSQASEEQKDKIPTTHRSGNTEGKSPK